MEYTKSTKQNIKSCMSLGMSLEEAIRDQMGPRKKLDNMTRNEILKKIQEILSDYSEICHELAIAEERACGVDDNEINELSEFLNLLRK